MTTNPLPTDPLVLMLRPTLDGVPELAFPAGYSVRPIKPGDVALWTDIWRDADPNLHIAADLFHREFGSDWETIGQRCFLIASPEQRAVGTISAWFDPAFRGQDFGRIHWVALRASYQRQGLGKPALAFALRKLAHWHRRCYLATQVSRLPAIKLYLHFGFKPDLPDQHMLKLWRGVQHRLNHPALAAL